MEDSDKVDAQTRCSTFSSPRHIYVNSTNLNTTPTLYASNQVRTSKYTIFTFLPKNVYEQFHGAANFYFLSLVILQVFPQFKQVGLLITALPIVVIITATALKDGIEDLKRHSADNGVNATPVYLLSDWSNVNIGLSPPNFIDSIYQVLTNGFHQSYMSNSFGKYLRLSVISDPKYPPTLSPEEYDARINSVTNKEDNPFEKWVLGKWRDIKVGDFILLRNHDKIPADLLIISTSELDSTCYIETKNLDGETNLKIKKGAPELSAIRKPSDCKKIVFEIVAEKPNANLYTFSGTINLCEANTEARVISIGPNQLLLRGCVLRNTGWLIGLAIYTGADTKLRLNSGPTPSKRSRVDKQINPKIVLNAVILTTLCLICGVLAALYDTTFLFELAYYIGTNQEQIDTPIVVGFLSFCQCLIIFQNIIPIALYISLEVTKTAQSYMINKDVEMFDSVTNESVQPTAWNLCDDLGQIEYIFSDKTGTLTSNAMDFRKASINGIVYGKMVDTSILSAITIQEKKQKIDEERLLMKDRFDLLFPAQYIDKNPSFIDATLPADLQSDGIQAQKIREFFTLLAVCHTVLVEKPDKGDPKSIFYRAQSPDEAALVSAAKNVGFACLDRSDNKVEIDFMGSIRTYTILNIIEFNSDRKRMSIIVKRPEGEIILLCKGADSVIYDRLDLFLSRDIMEKTSSDLESFANDGLRTLCLSHRIIPQTEYDSWCLLYEQAQSAIIDREQKCDEVAEKIEQDLILMGATAIEDKLQDGVSESILLLAKAGIKLWVLTGDKMETAINIGFSCNLLQKSMILIVIQSKSQIDTLSQLKEALCRFWNICGVSKEAVAFALIIDGHSLKFALELPCKTLFLELGCRCKAVLCCRVSPLQKALVVRLVRDGLGAICLAIGDGANDVSMIQEADIGIGISGKEGLQAVMASDYSIAQFRYLSRLLLVHGRWAYVRSSELVLNYFYKNVFWLFILFWHQFYCGFSAGLVMDFTYSMFLNTVFTFLPTILVGIFDQDINAELSLAMPEIYKKGIQQELFSTNRFWIYIAYGVYHSLVCYFGVLFLTTDGVMSSHGYDFDSISLSTTVAFIAITVINLFSTTNWNSWTWITHISFWISMATWIIYIITFSAEVSSSNYGILNSLLVTPLFYATLCILIFLNFFPRVLIKALQQALNPSDTDIIQEIQSVQKIQKANLLKSTQVEVEGGPSKSKKTIFTKSVDLVYRRHAREHVNNIQDCGLDGFGTSPKSFSGDPPAEPQITQTLSQNIQVNVDKPKYGALSDALKSGVHKASQIVKKIKGDGKSKIHKAGSLIYMGNGRQTLANTGYAFSHSAGMQDIITPLRQTLEPFNDELSSSEEPNLKQSRRPSSTPFKLKEISKSIQTALGLTKPTASNNVENRRAVDASINSLGGNNITTMDEPTPENKQ